MKAVKILLLASSLAAMPIAGAAQIGVNDYDDVLWGDVKGDTIEPVNDTYHIYDSDDSGESRIE